jgi:cardiolipin synthase
MAFRSDLRASLTIPNLITLARILLTPLFIIFLIQGRYRQAFIVFLLAGLSDLADGLIARVWQQKSPLGAYLDPLADKLLMSASFVTLSISRTIPPWLTVVVLSRDMIIALGVTIFRLADLPLQISPSRLGKWTTTLQILTILLVLTGKIWPLPRILFPSLFWATGILTVISGVHYVFRGLLGVSQPQGRGEEGSGGHG